MFQFIDFKNTAILVGGLPAWKVRNFPMEKEKKKPLVKGDFKVDYQIEKIKETKDILDSFEDTTVLIVDALSSARFCGTATEPRKKLKIGHIPNSVSLPYEEVLCNGRMKTDDELLNIFSSFKNNKEIIFTCGLGVTAAILALGAAIAMVQNVAVYLGSWIAWGSAEKLSISL